MNLKFRIGITTFIFNQQKKSLIIANGTWHALLLTDEVLLLFYHSLIYPHLIFNYEPIGYKIYRCSCWPDMLYETEYCIVNTSHEQYFKFQLTPKEAKQLADDLAIFLEVQAYD